MPLPPLAPFPPSTVRRSIPPAEWESCVEAWSTLTVAYLRLPQKDFVQAAADEGPLITFLTSYFQEAAKSLGNDSQFQSKKAHELKKTCFLLSHRLLSGEQVPQKLLHWTFLSNLSHVFLRSERLRELLSTLWKKNGDQIESSLQKLKSSLTKMLESKTPAAAEDALKELVPLLHTSSEVATFFIAGTDFLDALCASYTKASPELRPKIVTVASLALLALTKGEKPSYSLLSDTLYSLKSNAETVAESSLQPSLLSDLVTNTPLIARIRDSGSGDDGMRVKNFVESLSSFRQPSLARPKQVVRRKAEKGKRRAADDEFGHGAGGVSVHQMSLVTQIQDLFPDLGSAFIILCLREYNDDVEQVTAHLLDDSLPTHLEAADRTAQLPPTVQDKTEHHHSTLEPRSTPVFDRRNIHDNDELDQLAVDASRLHIGRKNENLTADKILADKKNAPNKAAILSALATFDLDDDERDDTYDVEDVGGTVDSAVPGDEAADLRDKNEEALFRAYSLSKDTFNRDAATRRGKAREALRSETGMTDEAIEGWSIMLARDPRNLRRLEAKFSTFDGQQREIASTRWRDSPAGSGTEDSEGQGGRGGFRGRGNGRGRGRGRGGRGGPAQGDASSAAGSSSDKQTQVNRHRKEANKSSRANHNRRDQRARKMARGGLPG
ncbi:hypothetical protein IWX90DRAFT_436994 [Phyllosticta citrichinensis]|uniref:CUE domain-containing protein n=1 Tax=Phyllosticta citrichinensis TaxID=1130410 RepID=A0ABR1XRZ1_9PEZI